MKYTVLGFQQDKLIKSGLDTDDALILRTIKDMYSSASMEFIIENGEKYMWVNRTYLQKQIPIIGSKRTLIRRLKKIEEKNLIKTIIKYEKNGEKGTFSYIAPTIELDKLQDYDYPMTECHRGYDKTSQGVCQDVVGGMTKCHSKDTSIRDTSIRDASVKDNKEQPPKDKDNTNPYSFYEQNFGMLTPHIADRIKGMEEDIGETMVLIAMQESIECGAFNIRYVETVVNSWLKKNITTPQAYMIHKTKRTAKKQRSKDRDKESRHVPNADETAKYLRKMRGDGNVATSKSGS